MTRRTFFAAQPVLSLAAWRGIASGQPAGQVSAPVTNTQPPAYSILQIRFADAEVPKWNGAYLVLANPPFPVQSLQLYKNGVLLTNTVDYTLVTGQALELNAKIPYDPADSFIAWYRY